MKREPSETSWQVRIVASSAGGFEDHVSDEQLTSRSFSGIEHQAIKAAIDVIVVVCSPRHREDIAVHELVALLGVGLELQILCKTGLPHRVLPCHSGIVQAPKSAMKNRLIAVKKQ